MGRRRSAQQVLDEATRLVIAYNKATQSDDEALMVWLEIGGREPPRITVMLPSGVGYCRYGGFSPEIGRTLKDGVARVKELLHEYRAQEADGNATEPAGD